LIHIMVNCCLDLSGAQNITRNSVLWRSAASCGVLRSLDGPIYTVGGDFIQTGQISSFLSPYKTPKDEYRRLS